MQNQRQRSVDASRFAMVPRVDVPRSSFDVVTTHKTTFDAGYLIPVYLDEALPGDSHRVKMTAFARLATPIVPLMDNMYLESFFFFVPNRLLWLNWERFMGEQLTPSDTTEFLVPQVVFTEAGNVVGSLGDYLGLPPLPVAGSIAVSCLPFRAYTMIWNDWFRDQDLQDAIVVPTDESPDSPADPHMLIRKRGKRHDYFTSARPWPQKPINMSDSGVLGGPLAPGGRMSFPQSGAPVSGLGYLAGVSAGPVIVRESGNRIVTEPDTVRSDGTTLYLKRMASDFPDVRVLINDIRTANAVQIMMERNARGGTRYAEIVRTHFGVTSPDARLQRSEYLGGGRSQVTVNPVAQTSASGSAGTTTVLGELAGVGTVIAANHGFSQSFTEHGLIIGMVSVRADLTYQQGINRMWLRRTQHDFYWPGLANLGEQAILSKEIYAGGVAADDTVFGYQERWSEYKFKPGRVSGRFRSTAAQPLDVWHLAQNFSARPVLNDAFVQEDPPVDRVLQVGGFDHEQFLFDSVFDVRMVRCMPMYSIPGLGPRL